MSGEPGAQVRWSPREAREIVYGGAVIVVLALVLAYSYGGGRVSSAVGAYTLTANFNRVDGLAEGADVYLAGIKAGTVSGQRLDDDYRAEVEMQIDAGVRLPTDTAVAIHTDGLFGTKFVVLDPGGEEDMLEPGDEITFTQDAMIVGELLDLIIAEGKANRKTSAATDDNSRGIRKEGDD